ncbi:MAG: FecR domain-containing protein [Bacteroidales bacterium]|nr:FecR domain-containing protein [Bacteroidales bacterium]
MDEKILGNNPLEALWAESEGQLNSTTFRELVRLGKRIDADESRKRRWKGVASAFSIAASLAVVAMGTFTLTRDRYDVSPLSSTRNLVADYNHTSSITLEDGTKVVLNAGSSLLYPEKFTGGNRIVYLTGEGNFDVAKNPDMPFIVKTDFMDVEALGTSFCIQAYPGDQTFRTTLKEGKVRVDVSGGRSYFLDPDMQLVYSPSGKTASVTRVNAEKVMAWVDGFLPFSNASFPEVARALEKRYGVSIRYNAANMRASALNVRFAPEETIDDVLTTLTLLIPDSRYEKDQDGNEYYYYF